MIFRTRSICCATRNPSTCTTTARAAGSRTASGRCRRRWGKGRFLPRPDNGRSPLPPFLIVDADNWRCLPGRHATRAARSFEGASKCSDAARPRRCSASCAHHSCAPAKRFGGGRTGAGCHIPAVCGVSRRGRFECRAIELSFASALLAAIRGDLVSQAIEQRVATLSQATRFLNRDSSALGRLLARQTNSPKSS